MMYILYIYIYLYERKIWTCMWSFRMLVAWEGSTPVLSILFLQTALAELQSLIQKWSRPVSFWFQTKEWPQVSGPVQHAITRGKDQASSCMGSSCRWWLRFMRFILFCNVLYRWFWNIIDVYSTDCLHRMLFLSSLILLDREKLWTACGMDTR